MTLNLLAEWSRLIFGTLRAAGVRDVVVSPGSRSTPFAYAALTTPGLVCHSAWDERSAGFFALGQARITGRPSAVLSTSGSAVVNYHPAIAEAAYAHVPLVVLSADRPFELQDVGAPQCMDQVKLFGGLVRTYLDLGHPDADELALDAAQRAVTRAVLSSLAPNPGPVHLNLRARKPLEPRPARSDAELALERAVSARLERAAGQLARGSGGVPDDALSTLRSACERHEKGLIVLGPSPVGAELEPVFELAARTGYPICAEATSQARFARPSGFEEVPVVGALDALLSLPHLTPELVIELGGTPTSAAFERLARQGVFARATLSPHALRDPNHNARWVLGADPAACARALAEGLSKNARSGEFARAWKHADSTYFELVRELTARELDEASSVRAALAELPDDGVLGVGNSLPVRDIDAFVPPRTGGVRVWSQRGLNGIDGLVSGAIGAAQSSSVPNLCLIGDVSFFHDQGGLALAAELTSPLALVVIDNGGGRIFEHLPLGELLTERADLARFWTTPHGYDLRHAAALYGLSFENPTTTDALRGAVRAAFGREGCTLIQVRVAAHSARAAQTRVREQLEQALS